jgi:predicted transposase YbfD/YdcC
VRRRIKSVSLSPEKTGLCGCWRFIAVERVTIALNQPKALQTPTTEIAFYASSHPKDEKDDAQLLRDIVGHWEAIENGVHRVRDVTFGEDACRVARPKAARNRATLCNLTIALFNLERKQGRTKAPGLPSWRRSMTASAALRRLNL